MSAAVERDQDSPGRNSPTVPLRFGAREVGILAVVGGVAVGLAKLAPDLMPVEVAAVVAAMIPRRHGWGARTSLAVIAAVFTLFVIRMWPSLGEIPDVNSPPFEPPLSSRGSSASRSQARSPSSSCPDRRPRW